MIMSALSTMSVPPAMHQPCTDASVGFEIACSLANVLPNVPIICTSATVSQTRPPAASAVAWSSVDQSSPNPAQNALPSAREQHDLDGLVAVGLVERRAELIAKLDRDRVVLVGAAQHEAPYGVLVLDADGSHHISSGRASLRPAVVLHGCQPSEAK